MTDLPTSAKYIVIGGGIVGCSTAYHLARLGKGDVLLLEQATLTAGSTWHAAGLVGQLRTNANITRLLGYSIDLYDRLEAETGQATGWKQNGGLRLACTAERWIEVQRQATTARSFGLEMRLLSAEEAQNLWPLMQVDDVIGAAFLPTDGQANPADITQALAKGARQAGAVIAENTTVTGFELDQGRIRAVRTCRGHITCEKLVLACGQWTRELAATIGINVPLVPVQHQYLITEPIPGVTPELPTLRDPDRLTYYKEEVGGLVMGGYEPNPIAWQPASVPADFAHQLLPENWDHFEPMMALALGRVPALETAGVKMLINGPESFTPDGNFILGEAPEVANVFIGAGFNAFGIAAGGGAGMALAEWVANDAPPFDLWIVDIRRFGQGHRDTGWVRARTLEAYARHYAIAWPLDEMTTGRPRRRSPLYDRLKAKNAVFGEKLGWERANWFARAGEQAADIHGFGRQNWFAPVGREHRAARETAALFDQTSFAKFELAGPDAEAALAWLCANDTSKPEGRLTYTQLLNDRGGVEADLTVARLAQDRFYIVTGTGFATRDRDWISRNIPNGMTVTLEEVTSAWAVLSLFGPKARTILQPLASTDLANAAFPFAHSREIHIAGCPVRALRVTYVGELGWELHTPVDYAATLFDALVKEGEPHGLALAGYRAIESLRLEKAYRAWGSDIGPDHSPLHAGLGWAVKLETDIPFKGREALVRQQSSPLTRRLAGFTVADPAVTLWGRETIRRNGEACGWLGSAGWGYTIEQGIGLGYIRSPKGVDDAYILDASYELEVAGRLVPAEVFLKAPYDPKNERVKG